MIKALRRIIEGPDYFTDDVEAKTPLVGSDKGVKIKALTKIIPAAKFKQELKNFASMFVPIIPPWMLEFDQDKKHYLVPKNQFNLLVSDEDVDDWNYLLERFNNLLANLTKLLNNVRRVDYHKIVYNKLLEREIQNRKLKLTEKLLEKTGEKEEEAKTKLTDLNINQEDLTGFLAVLAGAAAGSFGAADPLDAASIKDAKASGADLVAAAHLATLEASGAQNVADAFQVMLNRAKKRNQPLSVVITEKEQFSPYSAAIYGTSADTAAASVYGDIGITKKEIFEIAAKPNGMQLLVEKFGNGNAAVAQQVLDDFESEGPMSEAAAEFVGGAEYFMKYETGGLNERKRGEGGNFFRDAYSTGAIILPQLFDVKHNIYYNVNDKTDDLAQFIVNKPTIVDLQQVGEPLIVIPTERPIGQQILNILFKQPFKKIEEIFERNDKEQESKAQTPIQNNTTSINRSPIPESSKPTSSYLQRQQQSSLSNNDDMGVESITRDTSIDSIQSNLIKVTSKISEITRQSQTTTQRSISNIDTVSQTTQNVFGAKTILMTQDIYATEE
jgi:hypothetical protein